jgi:hypothetical protein
VEAGGSRGHDRGEGEARDRQRHQGGAQDPCLVAPSPSGRAPRATEGERPGEPRRSRRGGRKNSRWTSPWASRNAAMSRRGADRLLVVQMVMLATARLRSVTGGAPPGPA